MTKILLARHGHVDWIQPERFRGRAELQLSALGKQQAEALAQRVAQSWQPVAIYTSPLARCRVTGNAIAHATGAQVAVLDSLFDIDYGQWQGLTHEEVHSRWPEQSRLWFEAPDLAVIPAGETLAAVLVRAIHAIQFILQQHRDQTVVLVGHDSINRVLLLHSLGLPLSHYWRIKQEPCCLNEIDIEKEIFTIYRINETYHTLKLSV